MTTLNSSGRDEAFEKDPVCGARVDSSNAAAFEEYAGITYLFCSHECHERFTANPDLYASRQNRPR